VIVSKLLKVFLPHLAGICIERVFRSGKSVRIQARTGMSRAACAACGAVSERVHSRYERRLCDAAIGGHKTLIHLLVTRFFCRNPACPKQTFVEQVPGLTVRYGRNSIPLLQTLRAIPRRQLRRRRRPQRT
jgi:transposase